MTLLTFVLFAGVIKEDFLVDQTTAKGSQICASVATLPDGSFSIAWQDSFPVDDPYEMNTYIEFFDKDGNTRTSPLKLNQDSVSNPPLLSADESGHTVCVWSERPKWAYTASLYAMVFDSTGNPLTDRLLLVKDSVWVDYAVANYPAGFMTFWVTSPFYAQRYDYSGSPVGERLELSGELGYAWIEYITAAMNGNGTTAVSYWYWSSIPEAQYIMFNVLDSANNKAFHDFGVVTDDTSGIGERQSKPRVRWVDDERFAIFWKKGTDATPKGFQGKLFNAQGDSLSRIMTLLASDTNVYASLARTTEVSTCHGGEFALAYKRRFRKPEPYGSYHRAWGFLLDTALRRTTEIFKLPDNDLDYDLEEDRPAVDASDDRIIWVWEDQSQMREIPGDTFDRYYTDLHCKITDWDVGVGIEERSVPAQDSIRLQASLNRLAYSVPGEARLILYSVDGRKVSEERIRDAGVWEARCLSSGVYFARLQTGSSTQTCKFVVVR